MSIGLLKNVKDGISIPLGSREIQKTKMCTVLRDTLYLSNMNMGTYKYNTKLAQSGQIKMEGRPKLEVTHCSFKWRAAKQFNQLPLELRNSGTLEIFKHKVKAWIRENIKF